MAMTFRWALALCLVVGTFSLTGCQKPLFTSDLPRSPYERFMVLRGQYRNATELNAYGAEQPSLRERLRPLDQP